MKLMKLMKLQKEKKFYCLKTKFSQKKEKCTLHQLNCFKVDLSVNFGTKQNGNRLPTGNKLNMKQDRKKEGKFSKVGN